MKVWIVELRELDPPQKNGEQDDTVMFVASSPEKVIELIKGENLRHYPEHPWWWWASYSLEVDDPTIEGMGDLQIYDRYGVPHEFQPPAYATLTPDCELCAAAGERYPDYDTPHYKD